MQAFLLAVAIIAVPWMWLAKPYYLKAQASKHHYESIAGDENVAHDEEHNGHARSSEAVDDDEDGEEEVYTSGLIT